MDVKRYVPSDSDRLLLRQCESISVVKALLDALEMRRAEIERSLEDDPVMVADGSVNDDWRVKLGEKRGLGWLKKLITEIKEAKI